MGKLKLSMVAPHICEIHRRHAKYYETVLGTARELYEHGGLALTQGLALFDQEWPNLQASQSWARQMAGEDEGAANVCLISVPPTRR